MNLLTAMVLCAMGAGTAGGSRTGESFIRLERGRTEVVIATDAPAIVRYAADEATNLLAKVLGAPVPLVNRVGDGSTPVYIGAGPWTKDAGLDASGFARDEYAMRTFGRGVILVGRDGTDPDPFPKPTRQFREFCWQSQVERASLFALYDFLERYAGARFRICRKAFQWAWNADDPAVGVREPFLVAIFWNRLPRRLPHREDQGKVYG